MIALFYIVINHRIGFKTAQCYVNTQGIKAQEFVLHAALSSFLNFITENKTWLDSMKSMAERLPEAANRFASKKEKESMASTGGSTGGIRFVNYVDFSDPDSGNSAVCCFL